MSPYLVALVMDEVTTDIQGDIPWCMLFADDVVIVVESQTGVNQNWSYGGRLWSSKVLDSVELKLSI